MLASVRTLSKSTARNLFATSYFGIFNSNLLFSFSLFARSLLHQNITTKLFVPSEASEGHVLCWTDVFSFGWFVLKLLKPLSCLSLSLSLSLSFSLKSPGLDLPAPSARDLIWVDFGDFVDMGLSWFWFLNIFFGILSIWVCHYFAVELLMYTGIWGVFGDLGLSLFCCWTSDLQWMLLLNV
jgi:hypothetical protein